MYCAAASWGDIVCLQDLSLTELPSSIAIQRQVWCICGYHPSKVVCARGGGHACSLASSDADSWTERSIIRTDRQEPPAEIHMLVIVGKLPEMMGPTV